MERVRRGEREKDEHLHVSYVNSNRDYRSAQTNGQCCYGNGVEVDGGLQCN